MFYLPHLLGTEPSAPTASDRFSGRHFPELIAPTQSKQNPQKRCVVRTSNKKEKKADTNVEIVDTSKDFVQHLASKLTTLNETEH